MVEKYIKFEDEDRNYAMCSTVYRPKRGYERLVNISTRYMHKDDVKILLDILNKTVVADLSEWDGLIYVLVERDNNVQCTETSGSDTVTIPGRTNVE